MASVVVFDIATLRIIQTVSCTETDVPRQVALADVPGLQARGGRWQLAAPAELLVNGCVPSNRWMVDVTPDGLGFAERPVLHGSSATIAADGVAAVSFPVPVGTEVRFQGATHQVDDGHFLFRTVVPGVYRFTLVPPFPTARLELEVTANGL